MAGQAQIEKIDHGYRVRQGARYAECLKLFPGEWVVFTYKGDTMQAPVPAYYTAAQAKHAALSFVQAQR